MTKYVDVNEKKRKKESTHAKKNIVVNAIKGNADVKVKKGKRENMSTVVNVDVDMKKERRACIDTIKGSTDVKVKKAKRENVSAVANVDVDVKKMRRACTDAKEANIEVKEASINATTKDTTNDITKDTTNAKKVNAIKNYCNRPNCLIYTS